MISRRLRTAGDPQRAYKASRRAGRTAIAAIQLSAVLAGAYGRAVPAFAATLIVNTTSNADANDGLCSLTEAINAANNNANYQNCSATGYGADTITIIADGVITLSASLPTITDDLTIDGVGHSVTISGNDTVRVFNAYSALTLKNLTIARGHASDSDPGPNGGGAIYTLRTLNLTHTTLTDNSAEYGGAIYADLFGTLTLTDSVFANNIAGYSGGAIETTNYATTSITDCTFAGNAAPFGGAIEALGPLAISKSLFDGNRATTQYGGAIVASHFNAVSDISNSTFHGNAANYDGGALWNGNEGTVNVTNCTFANNDAGIEGGAVYNHSGAVNLRNTILADNNSYYSGNCYGSIGNGGHNLQSGTGYPYSCGNDIPVGDPKLGPVTNNGGPTWTMALQTGSAALGTGDPTYCANGPVNGVDQRGTARPQGAVCDVGAFEAKPSEAVMPTDTPTHTVTSTPTHTPTITQTPTITNTPTQTATPTSTTVCPHPILFVKWDATGTKTGASWANAYTELQSALECAASGDQIWVAKGTYQPSTPGSDPASFYLKNGVKVYGGFAGTETQRRQRNPFTNVTTLHGAYSHVVTIIGPNNTAWLDGFTITSGSGYLTPEGASGGGIFNRYGNALLYNLTVIDNAARDGAGIYNEYGSMTLVNSIVAANQADASGGGIYNRNSNVNVISTTFFENTSYSSSGGGMFNNASTATLRNLIMWSDAGGAPHEIKNVGSSVFIAYSNIEDSGGSASWNTALGVNVGHNIDQEPFVDDNLQLLDNSPGIDQGDNASLPADSNDEDLDGNVTEPYPYDPAMHPRISNGAVDMGAFEFQLAPPTLTPTETVSETPTPAVTPEDPAPTETATLTATVAKTASPSDTPATTATSTSTPTATAAPTKAEACSEAPRKSCLLSARGARVSLNAAYDHVSWSWLGGTTQVSQEELGDPVHGSADYHLCIYDTGIGAPRLVFGATVPGGERWTKNANEFSYADRGGTADGITLIRLSPSRYTDARIRVTGRGPNLPMPPIVRGAPLLREFPWAIVQLQRSDSPVCWESVFRSPPTRYTASVFADVMQ